MVALREAPEEQTLWYWQAEFEAAKQHVPGGVYVSADDLTEVLGPDAEALLASVDLGVDELIELLNAKTTLLPRVVEPDWDELERQFTGQLPPLPTVTEDVAKPSWKRRFVKAAVMATLLSLTGGGATALAMDKSVTVDVDGQTKTVHTYAGTVGDVLAAQGLSAGVHDGLLPSADARIGDGGRIVLQHGRQLKLTVDGTSTDHWVRATTVSGALREIGVSDKDVKLSADGGSAIPRDGMALELRTSKAVTLTDGGAEPRRLDTFATTVEELLRDNGITLGKDDSVNLAVATKLTSGAEIAVSRNGLTVVNEKESIDPPVQKVDDPTLAVGQQTVDNPGTPGEKMVTYRLTMRNGKVATRDKLGEKIITAAQPKIVKVGRKQTATGGPGSTVNAAMWDSIAQCESGGRWNTVSANGMYHGGLQFDHQTWTSNGGSQYAYDADGATREQQIDIANRVYAKRGLAPWGCKP